MQVWCVSLHHRMVAQHWLSQRLLVTKTIPVFLALIL